MATLSSAPPAAHLQARRSDRLHQRLFDALYRRCLVYNACWEDPAVDRQILDIGEDDDVLVITSAGCNALDYALAGARSVHAVDANPRQNALLELKLAALRRLEFEDLFALFGDGFHPHAERVYRGALRDDLSVFAQQYWDRHIKWFRSGRSSFYFHGLSGLAAYGARRWFAWRPRLKDALERLFQADTLDEQAAIYHQEVKPRIWTPLTRRVLSSQWLMSLLGVPHAQRRLVEAQHGGAVSGFIEDAIEYVATQLPLRDNYFWRVYFTGRYTRRCCPEYLKEANHERLRSGLVDRVQPHTDTVTGFLRGHAGTPSRFVLLDHMDWMGEERPDALRDEWEAILSRATPGARILLRSAHAAPGYLDSVCLGPDDAGLARFLSFRHEDVPRLQAEDRVHTYAGLVIADAMV